MGQVIALDTQIFTYVLENHKIFGDSAFQIIERMERGEFTGIFASIGIIELLTGPKKRNRFSLAAEYQRRLVQYPNLIIKNLNEKNIDLASSLRAKYNLRTPDAIHLATAIEAGANEFYTNDKQLKRVKEIKVKTLK